MAHLPVTIPSESLQETPGWMHLLTLPVGAVTRAVLGEDRTFFAALTGVIETGTWFMNPCAYLDPGQAWTGGFEQLVRPISFHLRTCTP